MTLTDFEALSGNEQMRITFLYGVQVASRNNDHYDMRLYRLDDFYVETKQRVDDGAMFISPLIHDILLVPYLDQVDLSGLSGIQ